MGAKFSKKLNKGEKKKKNAKPESQTDGEQSPLPENGLSPPSLANQDGSASSLHRHKVRVKALYNFEGMSEDDLPFQQGDLLEVDESVLGQPNDWWHATHLATQTVGFIPGNYVTKDDSTPQSQE
ncbi:tyrosine-protein kinase [Plakobranchus ocellatus]|uniref:Tyrosine-protein kinase n=1 Tax=Plakobranchus ocellatus TaxID=259542 RepID=A0AAV3ZNM9_9GAST|nr:tyrosine-protein kinase [Plakobranchus ocellatus]